MKRFDRVSPFPTTTIDCGLCGSKNITTRQEEVSFPVGARGKEEEEMLKVKIPVHRCNNCEFEFTTREGDMIQHNAVCRYLKVMTPSEVRRIREKLNLTQSEFSEITGIGIASINRWEKGGIIQNPAMDNLIFLVGIPGNLEALSSRKAMPDKVNCLRQKFSAIENSQKEITEASKLFALSA